MNDKRSKTARRPTKKKRDATSEFDREFIVDAFEPLSPEDQARWERARTRGNGEKGGATTVAVNIDPELLDHVDALATKMGVSRECLITRGIKAVLVAAGEA